MRNLTLAEVELRAAQIRESDDSEGAHIDEDALARDVLRAIADCSVAWAQGSALARVVATLMEDDRTRWYA